jgi:hypothetical protein
VSRTVQLVPIILLVTVATSHAQAYEPTMELPPPSPAPLVQPAQPPADEVVTSYRVLTMTADTISLGTIIGGFAMPGNHVHDTSDAIITTGMLGGFLATPLIHAARGHITRALGSYALRGLIAGTGAIIGIATATCTPQEWFCGLDNMAPGVVTGLAIAMVIDNVWLTDEHVPRVRPAQTAWAPVLAPRPGGGTLGFSASW